MPLSESQRVEAVLREVEFPGYTFIVKDLGEHGRTLQVSYHEPDVKTGVMETQEGRPWLIPPGQTTGQILQTALKALLTSMEHRTREHFKWRGRAVFQPHQSPEELWKVSGEGSEHHTTPIWR